MISYSSFSLKPLFQIISPLDFKYREFGFDMGDYFMRKRFFDRPDQLLTFLQMNNPKNVYVGGLYKLQNFAPENWKGHELVFDIDLTDYNSLRSEWCGCTQGFCQHCWRFVSAAINYIEFGMAHQFGFRDMIWVFTGNRGVHGWVPKTEILSQKVRMAIARYLTDPFVDIEYFPEALRQRMLDATIPFYMRTTDHKLKNFVRKYGINYDMAKYLFGDDLESIINTFLPRIDRKVTMDIYRLMRVPGSFHGTTEVRSYIYRIKGKTHGIREKQKGYTVTYI